MEKNGGQEPVKQNAKTEKLKNKEWEKVKRIGQKRSLSMTI